MTRLIWGHREYEVGVERGVFYPSSGAGQAWNGLASVFEVPADAGLSKRYVDGQQIVQQPKAGCFAGTIEAYTYPPAFQTDVLLAKRAKSFGFCYRTEAARSYKLHLVYNAVAAPSPYVYQANGTDVFKWPFTTTPVIFPDGTRGSHLEIDTSIAYPWAVAALEDILYGTEETDPRLPLPTEAIAIFEDNSILQVTDHGDGSFTIEAPDYILSMIDGTTFEVTWPSVIVHDADNYTISSL
jgi:hypothetical protein